VNIFSDVFAKEVTAKLVISKQLIIIPKNVFKVFFISKIPSPDY